MGDGKSTRAGELDRLETVARLDYAFADGQLDRAEHTDRVAQAGSARTLAELVSLTEDLQKAVLTPTPQPPRRMRRRVVGAAVAAVVAVGGVGAYQAVSRAPDSANDSSVSASRFDAAGMFTEAAIDALFSTVEDQIGTTVVDGLHLYADRAVVHVLDPSSPTGEFHYDYSPGGRLHSPQSFSGQSVSRDPNAPPIDLNDVAVGALVELVGQSPGRLGVTSDEPGFRVTIGGGEIWLGVNDNSKDSHLVAALDGTILGVYRCGWGCQ